MLSIPKTI